MALHGTGTGKLLVSRLDVDACMGYTDTKGGNLIVLLLSLRL